jgi:hypothetical protein
MDNRHASWGMCACSFQLRAAGKSSGPFGSCINRPDTSKLLMQDGCKRNMLSRRHVNVFSLGSEVSKSGVTRYIFDYGGLFYTVRLRQFENRPGLATAAHCGVRRASRGYESMKSRELSPVFSVVRVRRLHPKREQRIKRSASVARGNLAGQEISNIVLTLRVVGNTYVHQPVRADT